MSQQEMLDKKSTSSDPCGSLGYELTVPFGAQTVRAFLEDGFFEHSPHTAGLHSHSLAEVHVFARGRSVMRVGGEVLSVESGEGILIPRDVYHESLYTEEGAIVSHFSIDAAGEEIKVNRIPAEVLGELLLETDNVRRTGNFAKISIYVSFILGHLLSAGRLEAKRIVDPKYVIDSFFGQHYRENVRLSTLAKMLGVSEKHAGRLVEKHMGRSFSDELTYRRIRIAEQYMSEGTHKLQEIAEKVGFRTYSGFWKAYKRYGK